MAIIQPIYWHQEDPNELIHKYPSHEITLGSVLTVNDSQEACFFRNGTLYDSFRGGRYVLSSTNLPLLNKIINLPSGGETTFHAEVWFVDKTDRRNQYWGTGGLRIIDPYFEIPIKLYCRGGYGVRVSDGALFLRKFVGTLQRTTRHFIDEQFRSTVIENVKVSIASFMKENNLNINELGTEYTRLGQTIAQKLKLSFEEYGVELLNFNIEDINFDENDPGYQKVIDGIAEQARLKRLGVNYVQNRQIDIVETAAANTAAGAFIGAGIGLGMGNQIGGMLGNAFQQSGVANAFNTQSAPPPPPGAQQAAMYYVALNGQTTGPFDVTQLRELITRGVITPTTFVFLHGGTAWVRAQEENLVRSLFGVPQPPAPPQE